LVTRANSAVWQMLREDRAWLNQPALNREVTVNCLPNQVSTMAERLETLRKS
jgi:hypothetical protein